MSKKIKILIPLLLIPITFSLLNTNAEKSKKIHIPTALAENFVDVYENNKYYTAINYLRENGIINGYEDNTFRPDEKVNRAEALKMLTLASGLFMETDFSVTTEIVLPEENPFTDTPLDSWYIPYVLKAKEKGIINGNPDGSFRPESTVNLAEALKMYFESLGNGDYSKTKENLVKDTPEDSWFAKYTSFAISLGIINVYSDNTVKPDQEMTRGYLAEIIYRTKQTQEGYRFGKATWYSGIPQGDNMTTAHIALPFGTIIEVSNTGNDKSVQVTVNDRGPHGPGRVLDLSSKAFAELASLGTGVINVKYKVISQP